MKLKISELRDTLGYQIALLGVVALLASLLLTQASILTRADIAAAEARDLQVSLAQVLPEGSFDNALAEDTLLLDSPQGQVKVFRARLKGKVTAVVMKLSPIGYAGPIDLVVGMDADGKVLGVRVLKHKETPGLADQIETSKGRWIFSFDGKSLNDPSPKDWAVKKDGGVFDQFTGATITPRAIVGALKRGLELFTKEHERLFDSAATQRAEGDTK
ncbi:MAG: electron transport complex subunit RsxG [Gammaproteobacteria bacterium 28-57-27]|nr:MAG: electron transport complex subunit RsxG [Gammaproteobacteria bacterium 28-57-27]